MTICAGKKFNNIAIMNNLTFVYCSLHYKFGRVLYTEMNTGNCINIALYENRNNDDTLVMMCVSVTIIIFEHTPDTGTTSILSIGNLNDGM